MTRFNSADKAPAAKGSGEWPVLRARRRKVRLPSAAAEFAIVSVLVFDCPIRFVTAMDAGDAWMIGLVNTVSVAGRVWTLPFVILLNRMVSL